MSPGLSVIDVFRDNVSWGRIFLFIRNGVIVCREAGSDGGPMRSGVLKDVYITSYLYCPTNEER